MRRLNLVSIIVFLLASCAPPTPSPAPTATAAPTSTPAPSPTPLPTATATPTPVPTPTVIPGPFEGQPAIPYPSDEVVQGLGITAYKVVGEQYVALNEEGYVVAQAITDKKGEFTGWQRTVPFDVESGLVVPHPQETKPELFDLGRSDAPIPQFVNAMRMGGIEVEPEEVANNLQYQVITGADGKPYVIGAFNLDPDPNKKGETLEGPIPLLMWSEEGWKKITESVRILADISDFIFGSQIVYYKLNDNRYTDLASNFNAFSSSGEINEPSLWMTGPNEPYNYDYSRINMLLRYASQNNVDVFHIKKFSRTSHLPRP